MTSLFALREYQGPSDTPSSVVTLRADEFQSPLAFGDRELDFYAQHGGGNVYFDGITLFAKSLNAERPALLNREPLGSTWTRVPCPARLEMGNSHLVYESCSAPVPRRRSLDNWDTPTVIAAASSHAELFDAQVLTVFRKPETAPALRAPMMTTTNSDSLNVPLRPSLWRRIALDYQRAPRSVRMALPILPLVAWLTLSETAEAPKPSAPRPAASAHPAPSVSAATAPAPSKRPEPVMSAADFQGRDPPPPSPRSGKERTLEARAADAVARGAYAEAARLYQQLTLEHPERTEFASAARVMVRRAGTR